MTEHQSGCLGMHRSKESHMWAASHCVSTLLFGTETNGPQGKGKWRLTGVRGRLCPTIAVSMSMHASLKMVHSARETADSGGIGPWMKIKLPNSDGWGRTTWFTITARTPIAILKGRRQNAQLMCNLYADDYADMEERCWSAFILSNPWMHVSCTVNYEE